MRPSACPVPALALLTLGALLALPSLAVAQTEPVEPGLEQILERHRQAMGGERLEEVRSIDLSGNFVALSEDGTFRMRRQRPDRYRLDYQMLGADLVEIYDGNSAWTVHPLMGLEWPAPMSTPERAAVVGDADFLGPLVDSEAKGHQLELVGWSDFDGIPVWEIHVTRADGGEETWSLNADTYLPVSRVSPTTDWGVAHERTTFFDDWRPVSGVQIPHYVEHDFFIRHQVLQVEEAKVDVALGDDVFTAPTPEPLLALAPLAGDWAVKVETRPAPSPNAPWAESAGRSTITPEAGGKLLTERLRTEAQGRPATSFRTWSYDTAESAYRLTHFDDIGGRTEVFVGGPGAETDGRWIFTDRTGTAPPEPPNPLQRWSVHDVTGDGFVMEQEISLDQGETWIAMLRLSYSPAGSAAD
jgi:hypothetical protein